MKRLIIAAILVLGLACPVWAQYRYQINSDTPGCRSRSDFNLAARAARANDRAAFVRMFLTGRCRVLKAGTSIDLVDVGMLSGLHGVRPAGSLTTYFVPVERVTKTH